MSWILRLIPEPWATVAIAGAVILAYFYGNTTGNVKGRYEAQLQHLRTENLNLTEDLKKGSRVQSALALEAEATHKDNTLLKVRGKQLEDEIKSKSGGACSLSDAERLRIRNTIKIGR